MFWEVDEGATALWRLPSTGIVLRHGCIVENPAPRTNPKCNSRGALDMLKKLVPVEAKNGCKALVGEDATDASRLRVIIRLKDSNRRVAAPQIMFHQVCSLPGGREIGSSKTGSLWRVTFRQEINAQLHPDVCSPGDFDQLLVSLEFPGNACVRCSSIKLKKYIGEGKCAGAVSLGALSCHQCALMGLRRPVTRLLLHGFSLPWP